MDAAIKPVPRQLVKNRQFLNKSDGVKPESPYRRTSLRPGSRKSPEAPVEAGSAFIDTALPLDE
jgi:hypothetical protein